MRCIGSSQSLFLMQLNGMNDPANGRNQTWIQNKKFDQIGANRNEIIPNSRSIITMWRTIFLQIFLWAHIFPSVSVHSLAIFSRLKLFQKRRTTKTTTNYFTFSFYHLKTNYRSIFLFNVAPIVFRFNSSEIGIQLFCSCFYFLHSIAFVSHIAVNAFRTEIGRDWMRKREREKELKTIEEEVVHFILNFISFYNTFSWHSTFWYGFLHFSTHTLNRENSQQTNFLSTVWRIPLKMTITNNNSSFSIETRYVTTVGVECECECATDWMTIMTK